MFGVKLRLEVWDLVYEGYIIHFMLDVYDAGLFNDLIGADSGDSFRNNKIPTGIYENGA